MVAHRVNQRNLHRIQDRLVNPLEFPEETFIGIVDHVSGHQHPVKTVRIVFGSLGHELPEG